MSHSQMTIEINKDSELICQIQNVCICKLELFLTTVILLALKDTYLSEDTLLSLKVRL